MKSSAIALGCFSLILATIFARAGTSFEPLRLVSRSNPAVETGATPDGDSFGMQLAPDGTWVLFASDANNVTTNLHRGQTLDLYLYERANHKTTLISVDPTGAGGGDAHTTVGRATPDGRYVTFESEARNLVPGVDTNYSSDVFVRDLTAGTTRLISINWQGTAPGLGGSVDPVITPDGRYIAFTSTAEDLVEGDTNGLADVFVRDLLEESTERISVGSASSIFDPGYFYGSGGPRLSADGRWVAFSSTATNMVPGVTNLHGEIYLRDRLQGTTLCPSEVVFNQWQMEQGATLFRRRAFSPSLSEDGDYLVFIAELMLRPPAAVGELRSLWRYEIDSGQATLITTNVTLSTFVEQTIYTVSPNGRWVAFLTAPLGNSNDIELWDGDTGDTILATPALDGITVANGYCDMPELSADGRFLVFTSLADNLVTNTLAHNSNVFVRDTVAGQTELITADATGTALGGADLAYPAISHDGDWVIFDSFQGGFVPDDKNVASDVFLRQRGTVTTELVSRADSAARSASGNGHSGLGYAPFSSDGARLLFRSESDNLAPGLPAGLGQVYVYDVATDALTLVSANPAGDAAANAWCYDHVISANGRSVAFTSAANNLTPGDTNNREDVFLRDLESQSTILVSRASETASGGNGRSGYPALSHDGNRVAFLSYATDLVQPEVASVLLQAYLHDRPSQATIRVTNPFATSVQASTLKLSPSGRYLAYVDQHWPSDTWLYDQDIGQRSEILPGPAVVSLAGEYFSRNGRYLIASGWDTDNQGRNQGFLIRRDLASGMDQKLPLGPTQGSTFANITLDDSGRFIAFATTLGLVSADTNQLSDVYLLDFESVILTLVSVNREGTAAGRALSRAPSISGDGRLVAFASEADDLVAGDTNGKADVFLYDRHTGALTAASVDPDGSVGDERSGNPYLSPAGYRLAFTSLATGFVGGDHNGRNDVFLTTVHPAQATDADGDGMADEWELAYFDDLQAPSDADPDLDGFINRAEFIVGTDPLDFSSHPRIDIASDAANHARLFWGAVPGRTYSVESSPDPAAAAWSAAPGIIRIVGASAHFEESVPRDAPTYYRLRIVNDTSP